MKATNVSDFVVPYEDFKLSARIITTEDSDAADVVFLHGAGSSNKDRALELGIHVASIGHKVLSFDFVGHGKSDGSLHDSSLVSRSRQTQRVMSAAKVGKLRAVFGFSMGGHTAIELATSTSVDHLVLFYPAIYPDASYTATFGPKFANEIRRPDAWRSSNLFNKIEDYQGTVTIIIGDQDAVIPTDLPQLLLDHACSATIRTLVRVPGATHALLSFLSDNPSSLHSIERLITATLESTLSA